MGETVGVEPCFAFRDVTVVASGATVLDAVTCTVPERGITAVAGPSGCGKSTLLRLCNRLEVPSSGVVRFRGTDLADLDPVALRRQVGMVFQRPTPFPGTGMDNLRTVAPLDPAAAVALLGRVGLDPGYLDRDTASLSGGEAQRLCLARTLATGCGVLLADECTSALDPEATAVLEALARRLAGEGMTIIWVTHDAAQRDRLADHRIVMDRGRVVAGDGSSADPSTGGPA